MALSSLAIAPDEAQGFSGSGSGTSGDPYLITSCAELDEMVNERAAAYKLTTDVDCSSVTNSGTLEAYAERFSGIFDGDGHSITVQVSYAHDQVGFIGYVDGGTIKNVTINGTVNGVHGTGGVAGYSVNGTFENVVSNVTVTGTRRVGGLVGGILSGTTTISNSVATGDVINTQNIGDTGGFIGVTNSSTTITRSYATGNVSNPDGQYVGGFVGYNSGAIRESFARGTVDGRSDVGGFVGGNNGTIYDAYARGNVTASEYAGGFVGSRVTCGDNLRRAYSTGSVTADDFYGGFAGYDECSSLDGLFWDNQTSGLSTSDQGTGKTTLEMKNIETFTNSDTVGLGSPVWDFTGTQNDDEGTDDIWAIDGVTNNGYAFFGWYQEDSEEEDTNSVTTLDTPTGQPVTIAWNNNCDLNLFSVKAEQTLPEQDVAFEYPNGLVNFTFQNCNSSEVAIDLYFSGVEHRDVVLRKFLPSTNAYFTLTDATVVATTIDNVPTIKATYVVVDNGPLDTNPAVGVISDPAGIARAVIGSPRTGGGGTAI